MFKVEYACVSVPCVVTSAPWQRLVEGHEQVVDGPGDDDVVVDADDPGDQHHTVTYPCKTAKGHKMSKVRGHLRGSMLLFQSLN